MERLKRLVLQNEDEIVRRMFEHACSRGYGQRMPALEEGYRVEVGTMTANLVQTLGLEGDVRPPSAAVDLRNDPVAAVGARLARVRGSGTPDSALVVGLLKCYRHAYLDLLESAGFEDRDLHEATRAVGRFFDRMELGAVHSRAAGSVDASTGSAAERRGALVEERNRYLAAFSSLPLPALFIDHDGHVEHINAAASLLFGPPDATRSRYYQDPADREPPPVLAREIADFRDALEAETSFEREIRTRKGTRFFQVRFTKTPGVDSSFTGVLVVLNDLTYRRNAEEALRRSQAQYAGLFAHMPIGFVHTRVLLDRRNRPADHTVLEVNPAFEQMSGGKASALVGRPVAEVLRRIGSIDADLMEVLGRAALTGEHASFDARLGQDGRWVSVSVFSPTPGHVALLLSDITGVKSVEQSLARSRDFYLTLLEGLPSLVWRAGPGGDVDFVNSAWLEFTGAGPETSPGEAWLRSVHPEDVNRRLAAVRVAVEDLRPFEVEYRLRHAEGEYRWVRESGRPFEGLDGDFAGIIGTTVDVSEQRRRDETLEQMATHDPLTRLPNGRLFEESLTRAVSHAQRGHAGALMLVDLDRFAALNDSAGRAMGDVALRRTAELLSGLVRADDLVARVGADEFAVLLQDASPAEAQRTAGRLLDASRRAAAGPDGSALTVSVGLVEIHGDADPPTLLRRADSAMFRAREAGGDRFVLYGIDLRLSDRERDADAIVELIDTALSRDAGLVLHYQPAFRLRDGAVAYCEALVRVLDGDGHMLEPDDFLEAAEAAGRMPGLTRWVVRRVIADLRRVPGAFVSVNLSGSAMCDRTLLVEASAWAAASGVGAERISFELAEDDVLRDLDEAVRWTQAAREFGFSAALDHVGGGHTSFAHLRELAPDRLTVDGVAVRSLVGDAHRVELIESLQAVAAGLGIGLAAQGVDSAEALDLVRTAGFNVASGHHLGRPAPELVLGSDPAWFSRFPSSAARQG